VRTISGVSNLTAGGGPSDGKRLVEAAYLSMLAASGLTMALVNILHESTVRMARAVKALQNPAMFTWPVV
jgi:hypothetical protein